MITVGIDVSKKTLDCFRRGAGKSKLHVGNDLSGFKKIDDWLRAKSEDIHVCMEATGKLWEPLAEYLQEKGYRVSVVNPAKIKAFGRSQGRRSKTDEVDAQIIADFCQKMEPDAWIPMNSKIRALRDIHREVAALKDAKTQVSNRLKSGDTHEVVAASQKDLLKYISSKIENLEEAAKKLVSADPELKSDVELLQTIGGVGWTTAIMFLTELSIVDSSTSLRQVEAFCGVNPLVRESGTSVRGRSKISKVGNSYIRKILYMASLSAVRYNPLVAVFADRLAEKGKKKKVILCAAMRKLLRIMVAVFRSRRPFDPCFTSSKC